MPGEEWSNLSTSVSVEEVRETENGEINTGSNQQRPWKESHKPGKVFLFEACCCSYSTIKPHFDIISWNCRATAKENRVFVTEFILLGLNVPGGTCGYLLHVFLNPDGLIFVKGVSDQHLKISMFFLLHWHRLGSRNISVSTMILCLFWDWYVGLQSVLI